MSHPACRVVPAQREPIRGGRINLCRIRQYCVFIFNIFSSWEKMDSEKETMGKVFYINEERLVYSFVCVCVCIV